MKRSFEVKFVSFNHHNPPCLSGEKMKSLKDAFKYFYNPQKFERKVVNISTTGMSGLNASTITCPKHTDYKFRNHN